MTDETGIGDLKFHSKSLASNSESDGDPLKNAKQENF